MKNEAAVLRTWTPPEVETNLAQGTKPNIEREQFETLINHPVVQIMDILEDSYTDEECNKLLTFLEYFSDQIDGHLEMLITKHYGVCLVFSR